jgi:hypothetical protein
VDFCDGLPLFDEHTGERISTELLVGALAASARRCEHRSTAAGEADALKVQR